MTDCLMRICINLGLELGNWHKTQAKYRSYSYPKKILALTINNLNKIQIISSPVSQSLDQAPIKQATVYYEHCHKFVSIPLP